MRFANLAKDYWELESGEELHALHPDTFEIPPVEMRRALQRTDAVQLVFKIALEDEDGHLRHIVERMWAVVTAVGDGYYLGRLINQPVSFDPGESEFYLGFGAEVPFRSEHVVATETPWRDADVVRLLESAPLRYSWGGDTAEA